MHHGMGDFNAGGKAVEDEPAGLLLEDLNQLAVGGEVFFIAKQSCSQVAVEGGGGAKIVQCAVAVYKQRIGAKDFLGQRRVREQVVDAGFEKLARDARTADVFSGSRACAESLTCDSRACVAREYSRAMPAVSSVEGPEPSTSVAAPR